MILPGFYVLHISTLASAGAGTCLPRTVPVTLTMLVFLLTYSLVSLFNIALIWKITYVVTLFEVLHCHMATFCSKSTCLDSDTLWSPSALHFSSVLQNIKRFGCFPTPFHSSLGLGNTLFSLKTPCSHLLFPESLYFCQTPTSHCYMLKWLKVPSFLGFPTLWSTWEERCDISLTEGPYSATTLAFNLLLPLQFLTSPGPRKRWEWPSQKVFRHKR